MADKTMDVHREIADLWQTVKDLRSRIAELESDKPRFTLHHMADDGDWMEHSSYDSFEEAARATGRSRTTWAQTDYNEWQSIDWMIREDRI